jgi:hypothetical protein
MKKIAVLIVFSLYLFNSVSAQEFRFGFQLSPTFTWLNTDDNSINGNGTNLGLKLAMMGEKYFGGGENYAFKFGVGFAFNQGGTLKHDMGGNFWPNSDPAPVNPPLSDGVNLKYGLQYVEIPFGLKLHTDQFSHIRYYAEFPVFTLGFNTQASGDVSGDSFMANNMDNVNINNDVNFFNLSWGIGGGLEYEVSESTALVAGIYYQHGFLDVTKDKDAVKSNGDKEDSKGTLRGITLRLGIMF